MAINWYYNPYVILFFTFWVLWTLYFIFNISLFSKYKSSFYIKTRNPYLIVASAIGQYLMISSQSWKIIFHPDHFSNFVDLWFLWLMIPLHFIPYPVRSFQFIIKYFIGKAYADKEEAEDNGKTGGYSEKLINFSNHRRFLTDKAFFFYSLFLVAISFIVGLVRLIMFDENKLGHYGSGIGQTSYIISGVLIAIVSIFLWLGYYFLRNVHDEIAINSEFLTIIITWILCVPPFIGFGIGNLNNPSIPPELSPIFVIILCIVSFMASFAMPVSLAKYKNPNFKLRIPQFRNVDAIIADPVAYKLLRQYMQKNACIENLLFLRDAKKYKSLIDPETIDKTAHIIYDKYIPLHAPLEINISSKNKEHIKKKLDDCRLDLFDGAIKEIKKVINTDQLPKFMESSEMMQYVKQLKVNAIREDNDDAI